MTKQAILFDLDGTLLLDRKSPYEQFLASCARLGHAFNGDTARRLERWSLEYWSRHDELEAQRLQLGEESFWLHYNIRQLEFLGVTGPLDVYSTQISDWFRDEYVYEPHVPDDVHPTLTHLRQQGMVVGLVSNRIHPLTETVTRNNLAHLFDFTLSAGEAGHWKPKPGIFNTALAMAGVEPQNATYVGDNYYADIVGARNAGLAPVLIDRRGLFPDADCRVIKKIGELVEPV